MWMNISMEACASLASMEGYTPEGNWYSHDDKMLTLAESLQRERENIEHHTHFEQWPRHVLGDLLPPRMGTAPFQFKLSLDAGLDKLKTTVLNRLMELTARWTRGT